MEHPDPKKHQYISFVKSAVRIGACIATVIGAYIYGGDGLAAGLAVGMLIAELIGVYEELV